MMRVWGRIRAKLDDVSSITYFLFCVFGLGSWVAINGIWAELPVLALALPECYRLAAILSVVIQLANIGPLVVTVGKLIWRKLTWKQLHLEVGAILLLVFIGVVSSVFLTLFWSRVDVIADQRHSWVLTLLVFLLAFVDCSSSVLFVPFMKHFPVLYLSGLFIGEGLSGVLPSVLALIQGSVNNSIGCSDRNTVHREEEFDLRFSPSVYFTLLAAMMAACGISFVALLLLPQPKREREKAERSALVAGENGMNNDGLPVHSANSILVANESSSSSDKALLMSNRGDYNETNIEPIRRLHTTEPETSPPPPPSICHLVLCVLRDNLSLLVCVFVISFVTNGALSSVSAFAFSIYGNKVFHLAVNLGLLANPLATLVYALIPVRSQLLTAFLTALSFVFAIYIITVAAMTHNPPILGLAGGIVIVSSHQMQ